MKSCNFSSSFNDLGNLNLTTKASATKRKRTDENGDMRSSYPYESKAVYLRIKNLYKKKLNIAANMHTIKLSLKHNKFPTAADFRDKPPPNRSESFKERWTRVTTGCKEKLSLLVLEDLNEKYQSTKTEIQTQLALLQSSYQTHSSLKSQHFSK